MGFALLAQPRNLVENSLGYFPLRGFGDFDHIVARNDCYGVAVGVEADAFARDIIDDNRIQIFCEQFLASVFQNVFRLGGEPNNDL